MVAENVEQGPVFYICVSVSAVVIFIGIFIMFLIIKHRDKQPLMKKQPKLLVLSVLGNTLILFSMIFSFAAVNYFYAE